MPIKFRCQHCRQFLGISRSKAGAVVDCPTCGRALRVPQLDGTVAPLPDPGMDPTDSRLSQALDELAQIAESGWTAAASEREARNRSAALATQDEHAPPALPPRAQPIPVEPPPAARPIAAPAGLKIKPLPARRSAPRIEPGNQDDSDDAVHPLPERAPREALGGTSPTGTAANPGAPGKLRAWSLLRSRLSPRTARAASWCGVAALALAAGFVLGRSGRNSEAQADAAAGSSPVLAEPAQSATAALAGRITFESDRGTFEPDAGARVIALPVGSPPAEKLPAEVLLDGTRHAEATSSLAALAGGFAIAAEDGTFALALPNAGSYRVLVVSARQSPDAGIPSPSEAEAVLDGWLDQPALIAGRRTYLVRDVRYSGTGGVPFDCVFERR
jgi:hypothetical protein